MTNGRLILHYTYFGTYLKGLFSGHIGITNEHINTSCLVSSSITYTFVSMGIYENVCVFMINYIVEYAFCIN